MDGSWVSTRDQSPMINMYPETLETISIVLQGLKPKHKPISDMLCDSDDSWSRGISLFCFYLTVRRHWRQAKTKC